MEKTTRTPKMPQSEIDLAGLGIGEVAYIRSIGGEAASAMLGGRVAIPAGQTLFCLYMADGTPVAISDSREAAVANAMQHDLTPISVH